MLSRYPVWLAAAFALALSFSAVSAGYTVGVSDARADAAKTVKRLQAQARKPAAITGVRQCGQTVIVIMSKGDGSQVLMTQPDPETTNKIARELPEGRAVVAVLPCPIAGIST